MIELQGRSGGRSSSATITLTWVFRGLALILVVVAGGIGYCGWFALKAEENLIALSETTVLVESFVNRNEGAWPKSWDDLLRVSVSVDGRQDVDRLRRFVDVDFQADPGLLMNQSPEQFQAICQRDQIHCFPRAVQRRCEQVIFALQHSRDKKHDGL